MSPPSPSAVGRSPQAATPIARSNFRIGWPTPTAWTSSSRPGALQYLPQSLPDLLGTLAHKPRRIIINTTPIHPSQSFYTLNSIGTAYCPYRIQAREPLIAAIEGYGYRLKAEWRNIGKQMQIPLEPEHSLTVLHRLLFRSASLMSVAPDLARRLPALLTGRPGRIASKIALAGWLVAWAGFGMPWTGMTNHTHWDNVRLTLSLSPGALRDAMLNLLFYVPFGVLVCNLGGSYRRALSYGAALSVFTEFVQVFSHTRTPALTDVVMNVAGAATGAYLALRSGLARGPHHVATIKSLQRPTSPPPGADKSPTNWGHSSDPDVRHR